MKKALVIRSIALAMVVAAIIVKLMVEFISYTNSEHSTIVFGS